MNVLIYDGDTKIQSAKEYTEINAGEKAAFCKGCFGCWLKTPGRCVMADRLETVGSLVMQAETVTIVSPCCYGGFSPNVKKILDRCIPGVMPFFVTKKAENGKKEQHHSQRYQNHMKLIVWFYGTVDEKEKTLARKIVYANGLNYWAKQVEIFFVNRPEEVIL